MNDSENVVKVLELDRKSFIRGYQIPNSVSYNLIDWFKNNEKRHSKVNRRDKTDDPNTQIKLSTDITVFPPDIKEEPISEYMKYLDVCVREYIQTYPQSASPELAVSNGWNIQWYKPNEGYFANHHERSANTLANMRVLVFMTYLNDLEKGGTFFPEQDIKLEARKSTTWIWPADFTHIHRGEIASDNKYIATGWFNYSELSDGNTVYEQQQVKEKNSIEFEETIYEEL